MQNCFMCLKKPGPCILRISDCSIKLVFALAKPTVWVFFCFVLFLANYHSPFYFCRNLIDSTSLAYGVFTFLRREVFFWVVLLCMRFKFLCCNFIDTLTE